MGILGQWITFLSASLLFLIQSLSSELWVEWFSCIGKICINSTCFQIWAGTMQHKLDFHLKETQEIYPDLGSQMRNDTDKCEDFRKNWQKRSHWIRNFRLIKGKQKHGRWRDTKRAGDSMEGAETEYAGRNSRSTSRKEWKRWENGILKQRGGQRKHKVLEMKDWNKNMGKERLRDWIKEIERLNKTSRTRWELKTKKWTKGGNMKVMEKQRQMGQKKLWDWANVL